MPASSHCEDLLAFEVAAIAKASRFSASNAPRLVGHIRKIDLSCHVSHLMRDDQMVRRIDGRLQL